MPRGGAHFSSAELAKVLSYYDVGVIHQLKPLSAGNRRAPKTVIISEQGKFLLKRRPRGKDDLYRVAFAHAVQTHLANRNFPVTMLIAIKNEDHTILKLNRHIYELFQFVTGTRYDGTVEATTDAGKQMGRFHKYLADFDYQLLKPLQGSFHDSNVVRRHLKVISTIRQDSQGEKKNGTEISLKTADFLTTLYNDSSIRVNELGFDQWPQQIVHGDWHPGNMLFSNHKIAAVLDFDSVRIAPKVTDLANGMLQFSIVGNRPNPADWPDYLDQAKLIQFLNGYREIIALDSNKLVSLPDLMIETIIAEAVLPIAATGFFGDLSGEDFLKMIQRKAKWIDQNREKLSHAITH